MDIRNRSALKESAAASLGHSRNEKQIITLYAGVTIAIAAGMWLLDMAISHAISGTGGLSNLGTRSILQTLQSLLPVAQMIFTMCWSMGYLRAVMNISRNVPADTWTLTGCFRLFGPIFRLELLTSLIYTGILFGCAYLASTLFIFTPLSQPLTDMAASYDPSMLSGQAALTDEILLPTLVAMIPVFAISFLLFALVGGPLVYSYRMASYCLLDDPRAGARASLRWSKAMIRGHRIELLKLDLSMWWYYGLETLIGLAYYIGPILSLLGVRLPFSATVADMVFQILYYGLLFWFYISLRNYREVIYVKAYDRLRIPDVPPQQVILGNIFQM